MTRDLDLPKTSAESVAQAIVDGLERGDEEIFPDPMSAAIADGWSGGVVQALQRPFPSYVEADPVPSGSCSCETTRPGKRANRDVLLEGPARQPRRLPGCARAAGPI